MHDFVLGVMVGWSAACAAVWAIHAGAVLWTQRRRRG